MATYPVHSLDTAPDASKATLQRAAQAWGFLPNLHAILAESPVTLEAYDTLFGLVERASLTPVERQVVFMTVNVFHGCEYCTAGHTYLSRKAGMDEDALTALRAGRPIAEPRLEALRRFTDAVLRERGAVGDKAVDAFLAAGFTREASLEIVTIIATKTISNYVNHFARTPLEGFMADPALRWVAPAARADAA